MGKDTKIEWATHTFNPWKHGRCVIGFPAYVVTPDGKIWSRWGNGGRVRLLTNEWKEKVPFQSDKGHLRIELRNGRGETQKFFVHRLVLELFVGPQPIGMEACHNDGDPTNNHVENLRWDTREGNWQDRKRHGRGVDGERNPGGGKLSESDAVEIKKQRLNGSKLRELAAKYGVSVTMISKICRGEAWRG